MSLEDVFFLVGFSGISVPCSIQEGIKKDNQERMLNMSESRKKVTRY